MLTLSKHNVVPAALSAALITLVFFVEKSTAMVAVAGVACYILLSLMVPSLDRTQARTQKVPDSENVKPKPLLKPLSKSAKVKDLGARIRRSVKRQDFSPEPAEEVVVEQRRTTLRAGAVPFTPINTLASTPTIGKLDVIGDKSNVDASTSAASNLLGALSDLEPYVDVVPPPKCGAGTTSFAAKAKPLKKEAPTNFPDVVRALGEFVLKSRDKEKLKNDFVDSTADVTRLSEQVEEQAQIAALLQRAQQKYAPEEPRSVAANLQARIEKIQQVVHALQEKEESNCQGLRELENEQHGQALHAINMQNAFQVAPPDLPSNSSQIPRAPPGLGFDASDSALNTHSVLNTFPSAGSYGHFNGACRPCVFLHKYEGGCSQGAQCSFCHLCNADEVKAKRKANKAKLQDVKNRVAWQQYNDDREKHVALRAAAAVSCFGMTSTFDSTMQAQVQMTF